MKLLSILVLVVLSGCTRSGIDGTTMYEMLIVTKLCRGLYPDQSKRTRDCVMATDLKPYFLKFEKKRLAELGISLEEYWGRHD